ncbi:transglutaminase-like domain-containing protein, partial [Barnesiella intestinihominis]|uniref:transglutaminase-like domain-containing protein n=1 Tax=Barnesiella intestinihominis TaxID=487174 RepID=UPI003AB7781D
MIAQAEHKDTIINRQGKTKDIMQAVVDCYNSDYSQVQELADNLPGNDTLSRCRAVFDFVDKNIKYQIDPLQKQWIRTPARLWSDGEGDCKSFSIFICSCLRCMGIPHLFRFAAYEGNSDPTHVYAVAIDESGKEIIVDPVYRDENGKAVFNKECPYTKKIDMKGTTEISRLSGPGIGYFTETEMIEIEGKEYLPRVEQDFLINLNALNTLYKGAVAAKDAAFANRIENLMDVATVAILLYEYSEDGFGDVEKGISCLRVMYDEGAFNQPVGTTNEQRSQVMNIMVSAIVQKSADVIANEEDIDYLLETTGISTPGFDASEFLGSDVAVGRASYRQMRAASLSGSKPTQAEINKIEQTLTTNAEYFMYSFIPDSRVSEFSHLPVVLEKRAYYKDFYNKLNKNNVLTQEQALSVVNSAIYSKYGYSGPIFLIMIRDGKIPVVGDILSIITVVAGLISAIGALLSKIFGKDEDEMNEELKVNGPSSTDGLFTVTDSNNSYPDNSTTDNPLLDFSKPTGTVASSNLLGILLVGGVLMALIFGGSGDKKKKN